jgi:hypothetical protein
MWARRTKTKTSEEVGLVHGFRSGLEGKVGDQIKKVTGLDPEYEKERIEYEWPARKAKYTPDFKLPNGIFIETKGRFTADDRQKHLLIKAQCPELDIRFVFSNSNSRIRKGSPTTYADWCRKYGFTFADKLIPLAWFK